MHLQTQADLSTDSDSGDLPDFGIRGKIIMVLYSARKKHTKIEAKNYHI